jgi:hypothetical protein
MEEERLGVSTLLGGQNSEYFILLLSPQFVGSAADYAKKLRCSTNARLFATTVRTILLTLCNFFALKPLRSPDHKERTDTQRNPKILLYMKEELVLYKGEESLDLWKEPHQLLICFLQRLTTLQILSPSIVTNLCHYFFYSLPQISYLLKNFIPVA